MDVFLMIWRAIVLLLNLLCVASLLSRFVRFHRTWKPETRDLWWTLLLWSFAAITTATQGIIEHRKLTVGLVFITFASMATPIILRRKTVERQSWLDR